MQLTIYQVDAFADKVFEGNPAAICPLNEWLADNLMQSIAAENNLSETAFFVPTEAGYHIRWFTPTQEVDLCGHATLASASIIFDVMGYEKNEIIFESRSGRLEVRHDGEKLSMDFPSQPPVACDIPEQILRAFGEEPVECLRSEDYIVVFDDEKSVLSARPDLALFSELDLRAVVITSKAEKYDFILRCFAPKYGINEDPVTGSVFTQLAPYWSEKLGKKTLNARQVSARGGNVVCESAGERVRIAGRAVRYMEGIIELDID